MAGGIDIELNDEVILTPDQRVRVFVSSTLQELAEERSAVRAAIEEMHLLPVMFELGARAHPPRSLYRSYLEQSHVFVGIYWQRYGWVAPGMEVSGLEDEYLLARGKRRLVYIKEPAPDREPELDRMLGQVRDEGEFSYKSFRTPAELARFVADDLAVLLSESFQVRNRRSPEPSPSEEATPLPVDPSPFVGRRREMTDLLGLIEDPSNRVVTLTGPGGIGKTRLAVQVAARRASLEPVAYVPLSGVLSGEHIPTSIAHSIGLRDPGRELDVDCVSNFIGDRELLLLLDSMEHLVSCASCLTTMLERNPGLRLLVTSREALRLRGEREFPVPPLGLPEPKACVHEVLESDAVQLFASRAAAVRWGFTIDQDTAPVVAEICNRLEGIPLAIELAAARARLMPPQALLSRLEDRLGFLVGGHRDLPEHQRALRSTIEWSFRLLDERESSALICLSLFSGRFTLAAAEAVVAPDTGPDILEMIASLVDKSLLRAEVDPDEPRFRMLGMIRDFTSERLHMCADEPDMRARHAEFFLQRCLAAERDLRGPQQALWVEKLEADASDIRDAAGHLIAQGRHEDVAAMGWGVWLFGWIRGYIDETRSLVAATLDGDLSPRRRSQMLSLIGIFDLWKGRYDTALPALIEASQIADEIGDDDLIAHNKVAFSLIAPFTEGPERARQLAQEAYETFGRLGNLWGKAIAATVRSWIDKHTGAWQNGPESFEEAVALGQQVGDDAIAAMALANLAEYRRYEGRRAEAAIALQESLSRYRTLRMPYACSYTIDAVAHLVAADSPVDAARLLASGEEMRRGIGAAIWETAREAQEKLVANVRSRLSPEEFDDAWQEGARLNYPKAVDNALAAVQPVGAVATTV